MRRNPASAYTSPELAQREWKAFFRTHPQLIGHSADLPEPGAFLTRSDFGVPILATRDATGRFRAFVNVCRHRGAIVEQEPRGKRTKFSCPFHAWTYSNDGELVALPKIGLPAEERYGFLWVHPQPDGELDLDALLGALAPELESWDFGRMGHVGEDTYDMVLNWKLAMDTFGETYHFKVLHRNTLAANFHGSVQAYDVFGRNHRMTLCLKSIDALRDQPESSWHITQGAFPVYYLFPNIQLNVGENAIILVRAYPDPHDPGCSISRVSFYADRERLEAHGDEVRTRLRFFGEVVRDEDYRVAETCQRGAEAGLQQWVLFGRNEPALHHYHNTYREALGMEPLPLVEG
jgi:phenylpropionate dioxygenase-like ring-hydroxylating dioxygenase large terminal subunit